MKTIHRGNFAAATLLFVATSLSAQGIPHTILPGNDLQARQQEEARERERTVSAPGVRSGVMVSPGLRGDIRNFVCEAG
ncbi:hypothetical protein C6Q09_08855 [Burkholderia multivorans]|nr:hypothetical protein C6Q09_08855 [Burkholderia multivorans]